MAGSPLRRVVPLLAIVALLVVAPGASATGRCGDPASRPWCNTGLSPDRRADLLLGALTPDERISLLAGDEVTGVSGREGSHTGTSNGVPRVGLPPVFYSDGPVGVRQGKATAMPSSMSVAASFDPRVATTHARVIGDEAKRKGNDVVFGPAMNMLRTPLNGRTFEYFGEDPFLAGRVATAWTKGVQSTGVIANAKHFAANNQEGVGTVPGNAPLNVGEGNRMLLNAQIDERTLREIYLPQFEAAVKQGGAGSVMCAYPQVNGQYACENSHLLKDILKGEWGFKGFVVTDYTANHSTAASLNNGLDVDIFPGVFLTPPLVDAALLSGQVSQATIDEHVHRQLRTLFAFGFFDRDAYPDSTASIDRTAHNAAASDLETQGIVLLRNQRRFLPLDARKLKRVAVIGPEADAIKNGGGSSAIDPFSTTTPRRALEGALGASRVTYDSGADRGAAVAAARGADAAVVVVGDSMTEGKDKPCMGLNCGQSDSVDRDALVSAVADANPNTVVVLQSGGPTLTPWRGKVRGLLESWFPGQNGGTAIARVLLGRSEPGGRLPATFPASPDDEPTAGDPEKYPGVGQIVRYKEGVLIGYRWFDRMRKPVAYPFGYGLTWSSFRFSGLRRERPTKKRPGLVVSAVVKNTGKRTASAVPQLYVGMPQPDAQTVQPPFQLKGFAKVKLRPKKSKRVRFALDRRSFSYWSPGGWAVAKGCYTLGVGADSRSLRLRRTIARGGAKRCKRPLRLAPKPKAKRRHKAKRR